MRTTAGSKHGRRTAAVIAALTLSVAVAACGGPGDEQRNAAARPAPEGGGATIDMVDLAFAPRALTIERGQTVTFHNRGKVTHNAKGRDFFSRVVEPGGSYRHTFTRAGTFTYVCTFHPGMDGTVTVR